MATIKKQGRGYKITVSNGYDTNGTQLREHMTWVPDPGMTKRQIEKELNRQAVLFEEQVHSNSMQNNRIRFKDFADKFMEDYAALYLKPKTMQTYRENLVKINEAIGHIKLCDLKTAHINSFYKNLQENGMRNHVTATCKINLCAWMKAKHISNVKLAENAGVSTWTIKSAKNGSKITKAGAEAIASAMGMKPNDVFTIEKNMEPLKSATILAYHRTLSAVLARAVKWGYLQRNPADTAEKPSLGPHEAAYLDEADARKLLELLQAEPIRWRTLITFDLLSGLRRGELLGLRWQDIDLDNQTILIKQTSNYLPDRGVYTGDPKTATSSRPLRISRSAVILLVNYKQWQDKQMEALGDAWEDKDGRVFTTDTGAPIFPDSVTAWFTKFVKHSGLPKVTVHSLRHTYASLMIADGAPLVVVSHQLGHAQASTTANIYAHVIASAEAKAVQTFDRFTDLVAPEAEDELIDSHQINTKQTPKPKVEVLG